jgi:hypothetical protein
MTTTDIITTTLRIIRDFKEYREEEPGVWDLASHYEDQIDIQVEGPDDQRRVYRAANEILGIIGTTITTGHPTGWRSLSSITFESESPRK